MLLLLHMVPNCFFSFGEFILAKKNRPKNYIKNDLLHSPIPSGLVDELSFFLAGDEGKLLGGSGRGFPCEDDDVSSFLLTCGDDCAGFSTTSHS